ncbi:MAG: Rieske (2Fe-2S) protein [candidate division Zixibacteria bacterium]|nr:Rieske (2Fe-2S) protein [candidate division Zixibacteria bacterium]
MTNKPLRILMGKLSALSQGKGIEKQVMARKYAVFNDNGTLFGIEGECKHMRASLSGGGVRDGVLTCRWHGWQYKLSDGECITVQGFRLKKYDVEIVDDDIYLLIP